MHWGYIFAVFAHFYGFEWQVVMQLTPTQTRHYLAMVSYVGEWGSDAGDVPSLPSEYLDGEDLARQASRVGLRLPTA